MPAGESRHFRVTLRLKAGDEIILVDVLGREAMALIEAYEQNGDTWVRILEERAMASPCAEPQICLFIAFAAKGVMDELVEKCQELGVAEFRPVLTERTIISLSDEKEEKVLDRWYKITQEAAKQSGNMRLMKIFKPEKISKGLDGLKKLDEVVFFHPGTFSGCRWVEWLEREKNKKTMKESRLNLLIGPEGGFSENEMDQFKQKAREKDIRMTQVHLGSYILRVSTAVVAAVSAAKLFWGY